MQVEQSALSFYTTQRSAFAREGAAAVADFERGRQASARSPGPRGTPVVDTFSLRGFGQAPPGDRQGLPPVSTRRGDPLRLP